MAGCSVNVGERDSLFLNVVSEDSLHQELDDVDGYIEQHNKGRKTKLIRGHKLPGSRNDVSASHRKQ